MKQIMLVISAHATFFCTITFSGISPSSQVNEQTNKTDQKEQITPFEFCKLPQELQNKVALCAWKNVNNETIFEKQLLEWKNLDSLRAMPETSYNEQNNYNFHGLKTPIYFYTFKDGSPTITTVGTILNDAQPAMASGLSYKYTHLKSTELFLHGPKNELYHATLKSPSNRKITIKAACFSVLGTIAIIETINNKQYLYLLTLNNIKNNQNITLDSPQELDVESKVLRGEHYSSCDNLKGALFTLDGKRLSICSMASLQTSAVGNHGLINYINQAAHGIYYFDIQTKTPLTLTQITKRLGITSNAVAKLVREKKKNI